MTPEQRTIAKNEAKILARLDHPNVIGFHDVYRTPDAKHLDIIMEFADDGDLQNMIDKRRMKAVKKFSEEEVLKIAYQICLGLKHCHDQHIMHRDIKTANIFCSKQGIYKLGDFGISNITKLSGQSQGVGTPLYMAPEVWKTDEPYTLISDIWALGVLVYYLMAMRYPFET